MQHLLSSKLIILDLFLPSFSTQFVTSALEVVASATVTPSRVILLILKIVTSSCVDAGTTLVDLSANVVAQDSCKKRGSNPRLTIHSVANVSCFHFVLKLL